MMMRKVSLFYHFFFAQQEKASRIDRIVTEHQLFNHGLKELQNWVADTSHMLQTYCAPTADKNVLDSRMIKLEVERFRPPDTFYRPFGDKRSFRAGQSD